MKMDMKAYHTLLFFLFTALLLHGQPERWQQRVMYKMDIDFDVASHRFTGKQELTYFNNSPDTLDEVFYHLYFNAFQPNSMMDVRSRDILDPDPRVGDRIQGLTEGEIGYQKVLSLEQDGSPLSFEVSGTILEVRLAQPILPHSSVVFDMAFEAQVPVQIRRSGRDNEEGIAYSMAQWYPKLCVYDYQGWHADPYIGREFYGEWGDFDVAITIDKAYVVAASGYLQNPEEAGFGYETEGMQVKPTEGPRIRWHFIAPNVHDFVWAADPDYTHDVFVRKDGLALHFFYQKNEDTEESWGRLPAIIDKALDYINAHYGQYPYKQYSFIQGGDGGMEYPMATLILGNRNLGSLSGTAIHELMHSWYQMVLGSNENLYAWMDEGFTSWASTEVKNYLRGEGVLPGRKVDNPHKGNYTSYTNFAMSGYEEAMITPSDYYLTNTAYGISAYTKGSLVLEQLRYIIGDEPFSKGMLRYFDTWKFKHPNPNDFIRVMEKASGLELDWYLQYWVNSTHTIDYGVERVEDTGGKTLVTLKKTGVMPMPLDVVAVFQDGSRAYFNIPLRIMRGHKPADDGGLSYTVLQDWPWTNPTYTFQLDAAAADIREIIIDPSGRMADVNREDNTLTAP